MSALAHELLSPLNAIKGYTSTLLQLDGELSPEERHRFLLVIERISLRLSSDLHDILESAQLGDGFLQVVPRPVSLPHVLRAHVALLREEVRSHNIVLDLPRTMPLFVADAGWVRRLLNNLVYNAAKYSPQGSNIEVRLRYCERQSDLPPATRRRSLPAPPCALIEVQDHGIGIRPADLKRVFEPFYRGKTGQPGFGSGLGLHICKAVVEAHGGAIWARSQYRKGSTFCCLLPQRQPGGTSSAPDPVRLLSEAS